MSLLTHTQPLPLEMPQERTVRVVCITDPSKPRSVSGALPESVAKKRLHLLDTRNPDQDYDLVTVTNTKTLWRRR